MKKLFSVFLILMFVLVGCATFPKGPAAPATHQIQMGTSSLTVPVEVPAFEKWTPLQSMPFYKGENFALFGFELQNPKNPREFMQAVVALEKVPNDVLVYMIGFMHSVVSENADPISKIYIDRSYWETGVYSGVFVLVEDFPNIKPLIAMKNLKKSAGVGI